PSGSPCGRGLRRLRRAGGVDSDPRLARPHDRLGARGRADLPEDVRDVIAHRLLADAEPLGYPAVAEAAGNEAEHLGLAVGELRERRWRDRATPRLVVGREELVHFGEEPAECGLRLEQQMIPSLERNE